MTLKTTCIGAYPKPDYVPVQDWFQVEDGMSTSKVTQRYAEDLARAGEEAESLFGKATAEAVADQIACGIDVPTDGEQRRENYVHYHCRHLDGFDFENLTRRVLRDGAYEADLPTISGAIRARKTGFLVDDWQSAQAVSDRPVKITIPGPLTIADTTADEHYDDPARLGADLARALNQEVRALADAGCKYIQIDEPLFARKVRDALDYGVDNLARCFEGVPDDVTRVMHMCCGYPNRLDQTDYHKADPQSYFDLADAIDAAPVDQVSIEDAHRHNDLSLLDRFRQTTVIFGAVAIAKSAVEPADAIRERLTEALGHIDKERLWAAPDCGLGFLGRDLAMTKLRNLAEAARSV
ncbi:MAG: cobalamin-independent methionine synthase II family protein [Rhodospirillales bacterium]